MLKSAKSFYGSIEAGGTKFVCAVGHDANDLVEQKTFATTSPDETFGKAIAFFKDCEQRYDTLKAIGIGSFGPVNINENSVGFGRIASTPKQGWSNVNIVETFEQALNCPVFIDTDVNCALLAEVKWGAGAGLKNVAYITVGTGIGGGFLMNGRLANGFTHPEIGHMPLSGLLPEDDFKGVCPFHGKACFEGVASGPALVKRWNKRPEEIAEDHKAWDYEVHYLTMLCMNILLTVSPEAIVMGGGVMKQLHLFPRLNASLKTRLAGYVDFASYNINFDNFIRPPGLSGQAGIMGGIELAHYNCEENKILSHKLRVINS